MPGGVPWPRRGKTPLANGLIEEKARAAAEAAARESYGRLIAFLSARTRDIAAAEDALSEAFAAAIERWRRDGPPENPDAWLLTAARRKLIDASRRAGVRKSAEPDIALAIEEAAAMADDDRFIDQRLQLLLICAHPAIDEGARTPLMLQTILGLDAARIASAFLVSPATMSQRLVRAKRKIAEARIPFAVPEPDERNARADAVLDAIYAAFGAGYDDGGEGGGGDLQREAIFLGDIAARLFSTNAEALGLVALMTLIGARAAARRVNGQYVPLDDQDTTLWDREMIAAAEKALGHAATLASAGRYQLEAAIQSAHVNARLSGIDTREAIVRLYDRLLVIAPSMGAAIARAGAMLKAGRASDAIAALNALDAERLVAHQPYWATRAHALAATGSIEDARLAFDRAIGLTSDAPTRSFLTDAKARLPARKT